MKERPWQLDEWCSSTARRQGQGIERSESTPMQGHPTLPAKTPAPFATLAELIEAGELTCSAAQVARWLKVSRPTVIAAARRGELPGRQVGRQWRFSTKALARLWGLDDVSASPTELLARLVILGTNEGGDAA
jgi:excisionase family DNA binding protein